MSSGTIRLVYHETGSSDWVETPMFCSTPGEGLAMCGHVNYAGKSFRLHPQGSPKHRPTRPPEFVVAALRQDVAHLTQNPRIRRISTHAGGHISESPFFDSGHPVRPRPRPLRLGHGRYGPAQFQTFRIYASKGPHIRRCKYWYI